MLFFLILIGGAREFAWEGNFLIFPIVALICGLAIHVLLSRGARNEEQEQGAENPSEPG
jgi:hypothetical protein